MTTALLPDREEAVSAPQVLVIGYGNPGRQDDGLGPAAASALAALGWPEVEAFDNYQLTIEDAVEIARADQVWFVDASVEGEGPFTLKALEPAFDISFTSHLLAPETLLALARQQFGAAPEAFLLGIRGYSFEFEEGLTAQAQANLEVALGLLRRRIGAFTGRNP